MKKPIFLLIIIFISTFAFATNYCNNDMICNNLETKYNCPSDCASFRLGIGEPVVWMSNQYGWSIENAVQKLSDFNSSVHRIWFDKHSCLSSYNTIDPNKCTKYKQLTQLLKNKGIIIVGNDGSTGFNLTGVNEFNSVPRRNLSTNSSYRQFLTKYQASWKAFAEYFDEVNYWEVGNETNHDPFMLSFNNENIPFDEKAQITMDLLYHAKKGINEGNPNAFVFTPGLAPINDEVKFLDKMYLEIEKGTWGTTNPRDFFDGLTWHPYGTPNETWKQRQISMYNIAKNHGDDGAPVFFSEYGYSDGFHGTQQQNASNATIALNYFKNDMPWLWGLTWFRLYDEPQSNWGGSVERTYGLITSPNDGAKAKLILNSYLQFANNLNYNKYSFTLVPQLKGKEIGKFLLFRNDGYWFISCEENYIQTKYGMQDDIPVSGDFDGDNIQDFAIFRPFNQEWYIRGTHGGTTKQQYGMINDIPVPGDYNGDGIIDFAVFRPSTQEWFLRINGSTTKYKYGMINDIPVPADYDSDGKTDVAIYRPYDQTWHIRNSSTDQTTMKKFGTLKDIPAPGDYDGDEKIDIGVYRPSTLEIIFDKPTNNKIKIDITNQTRVSVCTNNQTPTYTQPPTPQVITPSITQTQICSQFTERYSQSQLNTHITTWKQGTLSLIEIIKRAKINKYCN